MSDESNVRELEARLARSLSAAAPQPAPDFADRVLRQTAAARQRRGWTLGFFPMLAAAAVLTLAIIAGLGIANLLPRESIIGDDATPSPTAAEATPSPTEDPSPISTQSPDASAEATADWPRCENADLGFSVAYPPDWWVQEEARPDPALDPLPGCTYFAPQPVDVPQNAGLPPSIAIVFGLTEEPLGPVEPPYVILSSETTTVDGMPAVREESEATEEAGPFAQPGDRSYGYRIELPGGEELGVGVNSSVGDYEEEKRILDLMMQTLQVLEG